MPGRNDDANGVSKTQSKKVSHESRDIGKRLTQLNNEQLNKLDLPERLKSAILEMRRIKSFNAQKRHLCFIGKLVREIDIEPIQEILNQIENIGKTATAEFHLIEVWRDRLILEDKSALTAFINDFASVDVQQLRQLVKQAQKEKESGSPVGAARKLFRFLRDSMY